MLRYAALDHQLLSSSGGEMDWLAIVGGLEPYMQWIQAFSSQPGDWRFVDARQATASYNQGRLGQETPFLEILVGDNITEASTEWMVPTRESNY